MLETDLSLLLQAVQSGAVSPAEALQRLKSGPFKAGAVDGFAVVDHHRRFRQGLGEAILGEYKSLDQIVAIAREAGASGAPVLITRLQTEKLDALSRCFPSGRINRAARTFTLHAPAPVNAVLTEPHVAIIAAGTSDLPVAEEAVEVCVAMNIAHQCHYDVGVAGIHRLLQRCDQLQAATALVVVAGMEGALPSVVAGLLGRPVFAVPTSVGYGSSFGGIAALLGMLNSCATGVSVVNIDNGFSAACGACQVVRAVQAASSLRKP